MPDESSEPKIVAYFVRHGSTELNDAHKFRGPLDPPLDEHGIDDAHEAGDNLKGVEFGEAFSSDKDRAQTTARALLQDRNQTFTSDPNLRAWNVGFFAGQEKTPDALNKISYFQRHPDVQIPQGESLNQFRDRVRPAILKSIQSGISAGKPSLTVAHSSVVKELSNVIHGDHNKTMVQPGGIVGVSYDGEKFDTHAILKPKTGKAAKEGYGN